MGDVIERPGRNGTKRYYIRFVDVDGERRCRAAKGAKNEKQALVMLHDAEAAVRRGEQVAKAKATEEQKRQQSITVRELAKRFCEEARPVPRKGYKPTPRVIKNYRLSARSLLKQHVLDRLGDHAAASVTSHDVEKLREQILDKYADDTCGKAMGILSRVYAWAARERLVACPNPCSGVSRPKETSGCPDFLTDEQCGRLIAWLEQHGDPMLHAMVVLAIYTGARKGELFGLTWRDVPTDMKRLDIEHSYDGDTKNGVVDSLKLHDAAIPVLNAWRNVCPATPQGLVFPVPAGKGRYRMGHTRDMLDLHRALLKALERTWDRPWHLLRHTFASALVRRGVPLYTVGKLLRDKNPQVVQRYAKLSPEHLATEVDRLSFPAPAAPAGVTPIATARARQEMDRIVDRNVTPSSEVAVNTGE